MISKIITGSSFKGVCKYVCEDLERALVLETEGVRGHDFKLMASDFETQHSARPTLNNAVFHAILSFYPGEKIDDRIMVEIAKEYLQKLGITETQFSITKHIDKDHPHVHVIANLVNNKSQTIKDNWIGLKGKKVAQQLTIKHGLKEALSKNLLLTHLERLNEKEGMRYTLYQTISEAISKCKSLDDLKHRLAKQGIETLYKYKGQTNELQGISFKIGLYKYKGSEIDRQFSIKSLQRTIQEQQNKLTIQHQPSAPLANQTMKQENSIDSDKIKSETVLELLIKPEQNQPQLPGEFQFKKRKKKGSKGLHL